MLNKVGLKAALFHSTLLREKIPFFCQTYTQIRIRLKSFRMADWNFWLVYFSISFIIPSSSQTHLGKPICIHSVLPILQNWIFKDYSIFPRIGLCLWTTQLISGICLCIVRLYCLSVSQWRTFLGSMCFWLVKLPKMCLMSLHSLSN